MYSDIPMDKVTCTSTLQDYWKLKFLILTLYRAAKEQLFPKEPMESETLCARGREWHYCCVKVTGERGTDSCIKFQWSKKKVLRKVLKNSRGVEKSSWNG